MGPVMRMHGTRNEQSDVFGVHLIPQLLWDFEKLWSRCLAHIIHIIGVDRGKVSEIQTKLFKLISKN